MESEAKIRRLHVVQGCSIKELVRKTGLSRNTIRQVLRADTVGRSYERSQQPKPKLGAYAETLDSWLLSDSKLPKKERRTAMKYYTQLQLSGYQGAYDSVQRHVKSWKQERNLSNKMAYIPLSFDPGEAYQFDWSEEIVALDAVAYFCWQRTSFQSPIYGFDGSLLD